MTYLAEVLADSPLALWQLDETSGASMADSSGNGRGGTYFSNYTLGQPAVVNDGGTSVKGSTTQRIATVPNAAWMNVPTLTVEAWVRPNSTAFGGLVSRYSSNPAGSWFLAQWTSSNFQWRINIGGSDVTVSSAASSLTVGQRHHVVGTFDGSVARLYLNGSQVASTAATGTLGAPGHDLFLGAYGTSESDATLDAVAVYSGALSAQRIQDHYTAGISAPPVALSAGLSAESTLTGAPILTARLLGALGSSGTLAATLSIAGRVDLSAGLAASASIAAGLRASQGMSATLVGDSALTPGSLAVLYLVATDTTYANYGYNYTGLGLVEFDPPIALTPVKVRREVVRRVHQSLPAPTLVDGRPT